jgi:hypothetical protein
LMQVKGRGIARMFPAMGDELNMKYSRCPN